MTNGRITTAITVLVGVGLAITGCEKRPLRPDPNQTTIGSANGAYQRLVVGEETAVALGAYAGAVGGNAIGAVTAPRGAGVDKGYAMPGDLLRPEQRVTPPFNTEGYDAITDNRFLAVSQNPLSTFAIDVDTASYSNVRSFVESGTRPPRDAVRIEELINYFTYDYAPPGPDDPRPFAVHFETANAPWAPEHRLVRVGIKGREIAPAQRPPANLVFLLDVSGSMMAPNKLPLVKRSLRLLVEQLADDDHVAIVVYAGASGLALPSTAGAQRQTIVDAIDRLQAGGSTNGAEGIRLAYDVAAKQFLPDGINRVLLATDGDFNVGVTNRGDLDRLIRAEADRGIFLTTLGFGFGNLKDSTLEQLADRGNGTYAYVDTLQEARRIFVEQATSTLLTIAKDVKVQVEFNPARVQAYRLIGYENRLLAAEDFNNDLIDAGDIGAGHTVTALYEIIPTGVAWKAESTVDPLKYRTPAGSEAAGANATYADEMLTVKIRHKPPQGDASELATYVLRDPGTSFADASDDFRFAAAVAGYGMLLRDSPYKGTANWRDVAIWAESGQRKTGDRYRGEFVDLVRRTRVLVEGLARADRPPPR